jgi:diaminopimelate epimerase
MGNPHIVLFVDDVTLVDLPHWGPRLEHHPLFPQRTNVHFVQVTDANHLRMRTWERGSGITLACGTGACAVLVAASLKGLTHREATVELPGGNLDIRWHADGHVTMTGPANYVCKGQYLRPWRSP